MPKASYLRERDTGIPLSHTLSERLVVARVFTICDAPDAMQVRLVYPKENIKEVDRYNWEIKLTQIQLAQWFIVPIYRCIACLKPENRGNALHPE